MLIVLAVITAIAWGTSDFLGGAWRRGTPVFILVAVSQLIAVCLLVPVLIARGRPPPADPRLLLACVAGLGVALELRLVYFAISRGDAFITAPVGALGAALAVIVGLIGGDRLNPTIAVGLTCALLGGAASAWAPRGRTGQGSTARKALICVAAAAGLGTALTCFHAAGRLDPFWSTAVLSASTALPAGLAAIAGNGRSLRRSLPGPRRIPALAAIAAAGVAGDVAYAAASRHGALSVVSAISSLYPLTTVALGVVTQGQRTRPVQSTGVVLALAGAALLGAAY
jgi:drug/metabolite transporter (DMT)-like permease